MKKRRAIVEDGPSLFPFLAVLICTMGVLIVLLVAIVRQAQASAETEAAGLLEAREKAQVEAREKAKWEVEDWQWKSEVLEQSRAGYVDELSRKRSELSHLEDHIREVRDKAEHLATALDQLRQQRETQSNDTAQLTAQLAELNSRLAEKEDLVQKLKEHIKQRHQTYSIVPYTGPNGTERRPIYIECLADRVVLQPTGTVLDHADFEPPLGIDNPLAAALRATREYWSRLDANGSDPYPLLIVRPGGTEAYAAARQALRSWEADFGYELVPEDMQLTYPPRDEHLAELQKQVIDESRQRRLMLNRAIPNRRAVVHGVRASRQGGFVPVDADGQERSDWGGFGSGTSGTPYRSLGERRPGQADQSIAPGENRAGRAGAGPGGGLADGGSGDLLTGAAVDANRGSSQGRQGGQGGPSSHSGQGGRDVGMPNSTELADAWQGPSTGGTGSPGWESQSARQESSGYRQGAPGSTANGNAGAGADSAGLENSGPGASEATGSQFGSADGSAGGAAAGAMQSGQASRGASGGGHGSPQDSAGAAQANAPNGAAQGTSRGGAGGSPSMGGAAGQVDLPAPSRDQDRQASMSGSGISAMYQPRLQSPNRRGSNWGLPTQASGAIPVARYMKVRLRDDVLELVGDGSSETRSFSLSQGLGSHLDAFVSAVWEQMRTWGTAGNGMYWKPILYVDADDAARSSLQELEELLQGSGLSVKRAKP